MSNANSSDPMDFLRNLWGNNGFSLPGMVAPTLDTDELEKQIRDLKTVEGWLRTNLSMLSMTIQNLEMQRTTLSAMKTMSQMYADQSAGTSAPPSAGAGAAGNDALAQAAMWPWNMMQQMQESMQSASSEAGKAAAAATTTARPGTAASATEAAADAKNGAAKRKKTS